MALKTPSVVDLRSDTVTQPTAAMRATMLEAPLGDDVFGDDPSVNALQDQIAAMLGFEAALFMPSGTQSNLCAVMAHCQRGDEYIVGQMAHTYRWEGGGAAVLGSVQPQPLAHQSDGTLALADIEAVIKPDDAHFARTRLLALENTLGGKLLPFAYVQQATTLAAAHGLGRHLDGARLFNAAVAQAMLGASPSEGEGADLGSNQPLALMERAQAAMQLGVDGLPSVSAIYSQARAIAQCFDSVSVCFSKGLGAPVGSVLCGSRALIARAHRARKMAGGGMRQAGMLAAAASYALTHHVQRLAQDHALAQRLAQALAGLEGLQVEPPQTNIVFVDLVGAARDHAQGLLDALAAQGILATGLYRLRFVTHLDVDAAGVDRAAAAIRSYLATRV
jgi:threonine aldolase